MEREPPENEWKVCKVILTQFSKQIQAEANPCFAITGTPTVMAFKSCEKNTHCAVQHED